MKAITFKVISHSLTLPSGMLAPLCQGQKSRVKTSLSRMNLAFRLLQFRMGRSQIICIPSKEMSCCVPTSVRCEELKLSISVFDQDLASQEELT